MSAVPDLQVASRPGFRAGSELREARERLGWDLGEVAAALRIKLAYLEAIEEGRISALPGNAYALGFLRTYATTLGLDADEVARRFRAEAHDVINRKTVLSFPSPVPERGVPTGAVILLGLVLAVIAYVGWYRMTDRERVARQIVPAVPGQLLVAHGAPPLSPQVASVLPAPGTPVPSPTPGEAAQAGAPSGAPAGAATAGTAAPVTSAAPASPTAVTAPAAPTAPNAATGGASAVSPTTQGVAAAPAAAGGIELVATARTWVQVRETGGHVLWDHVMDAGEHWQVPTDRTGLTLTTGNAGGLEIARGGTMSGPLGAIGAVRRDIALDASAASGGASAAAGGASEAPAPTASASAAPTSGVPSASSAPSAPSAGAGAAPQIQPAAEPAPHRHHAVPPPPPPETSADELNARELNQTGPAH